MSNPPSVQETTTATSNLGTTYTVTNTNDDGEGSREHPTFAVSINTQGFRGNK